jgi:hypothetical protein
MKFKRGILITGTRLETTVSTAKLSLGGRSNNRRVGGYFLHPCGLCASVANPNSNRDQKPTQMTENTHQRPVLITKKEGGIFWRKRSQGEYFQGQGLSRGFGM